MAIGKGPARSQAAFAAEGRLPAAWRLPLYDPGVVPAIPTSRLIPRVPSPRFLAVSGSVLALVLTLFSSFESVSSHEEGILWLHFASRLLVDYTSLLAVVLVVAGARVAVPTRLFLEPPSSRALVFSFAPYALAGMVGAVVRYHLRLWLGLSWDVAFPWELLTSAGAGLLSFTMVGFLASQYYPLMERLDRLRALAAMADQAADVATRGDFGRRLGFSERSDEVGHLARTVNHLLATVDSTLQSHRDFLADTSHELRNPLLAIRVNLELMERLAQPEAQAQCRWEALQQVDRMTRLVSDLLTLARLESGQIVECRPLSLCTLVEEAAHEAQRQARGQQVVLGRTDAVEMLGDEGRLRQVIANLITNALQHTPAGGTIAIELAKLDGWARIVVSDSGRGIPPADLPHIFERFYRVGKASSGGTGLGLAIVKHLCEAHGGRAEAESEPGKGSRFVVWLPLPSGDLAKPS